MEIKKNPQKDLENKKVLFFQIGLVFTLIVVLVAFEWKSYERIDMSWLEMSAIDIPEEEIEITRQDEPEPPPPEVPEEIEIVEDDEESDEDLFVDVDITDQTAVKEHYGKKPDLEEEKEPVEMEIFTIVEEQPSFPGGEAKLMEYLSKNISYPPMARESGIQGRVFVTFVVEPDGNISNVKVLRGIGGGCDEEAVRVVRNMPRWAPGKQRGKPVRVQFNLPIHFVLQ